MKKEIRIFFTALMFYTRIPCPQYTDHQDDYINKSTRYFPLTGWIVGIISFAAFYVAFYLFGLELAVILSLAAGILTTGAFHEDGLADVFDGFGGGWTKERILDIMKDSRLGTYGVVAVIFLIAIKYLALEQLMGKIMNQGWFFVFLCFITYHALARLTAINISFIIPYSRADASSKSKPIAKSTTSLEVILAYFFGLFPLILLSCFFIPFAWVLLPMIIVCLYAAYYFKKWIDGYTGDCLGAAEQIAECAILLSFLGLWNYFL